MSMLPLSKPFTLADMVGNGRKNREEDVARIRSGLNELNYRTDEDKADEIYTRPLFTAIQMFQKDEGLKQDGWLRPGGPTEERLKTRLEQNRAPEGHKLASTILPNMYDDDIVSTIKKWEGNEKQLYLDHLGNPTIGIGFMIPSSEEAKTYPFHKIEKGEFTRRAAPEEIESAFRTIKTQPFGKKHPASDYRSSTDIGIKEEDAIPKFKSTLRLSVEKLREKFPGFDNKPKDVQFGLLDMQYNLNNALKREITLTKDNKKQGWPKLFDAYDRDDYKTMAVESHRIGPQKERNEEIFKRFFNAQ